MQLQSKINYTLTSLVYIISFSYFSKFNTPYSVSKISIPFSRQFLFLFSYGQNLNSRVIFLPTLWSYVCDSDHMEKVFQELLVNSVRIWNTIEEHWIGPKSINFHAFYWCRKIQHEIPHTLILFVLKSHCALYFP